MVLVLCLTLLPTAAFAEGEDVSISGGGVLVPPGGSTGEGGGIYVAPGSPTEGGGGTYIHGEDTRTEIWCVGKPSLIQRSYDGTTDGGTIPIDLTFTDGTDTFTLKERTGFTAKKTFDSADAGRRTVTVEITLIGEAAAKYKLKAGEKTFTIGGYIDKAHPDLTVSLSRATCAVGEKLLPLLSVEGAPEDAAVTYYYTTAAFKNLAGSSDVQGSEFMPKIDENTAIDKLDEEGNNTYYVYARTAATQNYQEGMSNVLEFTVAEKVDPVASVTRADGTEITYGSFSDAWAAAIASAGSTLKLLADATLPNGNTDLGQSLTLDLNGYVLGSNGSLTVKSGAALTVRNAGAEKSEKPVKAGLYLNLLVEKGGSFTCTDGVLQYLGLLSAGTGDYAIQLAEGENHCTFGGFAQDDESATVGDLLKAAPGMALHGDNSGSDVQITRSTLISKGFNYFSFYVGPCSEHQIGEDGTCDYCGASYVASVTTGGETVSYTSLDDALDAAQDGDTVTLLSDVDLGETYVTISKSITFDLGSKTLSSSKTWSSDGVLLVKDAAVTVKNGKVKAAEMGSCAIRAYGSGASMTLEDVTATVTSDESSVMVGDFGSTVIKSGDYQGLYVGAKSQVTLEGGTFRPYMDTITTNENVKSIFWQVNETTDTTSRDCMELLGDGCVYVDETGTQVRTGGGFNTVVTVQQGTAIDAPVAKIGDVKYASLSKAINAVQNGGTITLLNDLDLGNGAVLQVGSPRKNFTIDLASHTLSADGDCLIMLHNGSQLTLKNGTLDGSRCTSYEGVLYISSNSGPKLTLENVTAKNVQRSVPLVYVTNGTVEFDGGSYTGGVLVHSNGNAVLKNGTFQKGNNTYSIKTDVSGKQLSNYLDGESLFWKDNAPLDLSSATETADEVTVRPCKHNWENGKCTVCQKVCDHGSADGKSMTEDPCPTCGMKAAAQVDITGSDAKYFPSFNDALVYATNNNGCTLKLLANVTDPVSINTPFIFDLNGHNFNKLSVGARAKIRDSGTTKGILKELKVFNIVDADGDETVLTVADLLEEGYAFKSSSENKWYFGVENAITNVTVQPAPIKSVTAEHPTVTVEYGKTSGVTLTATAVLATEGGTVSYQWYKIGGTDFPIQDATENTYQLPADLGAGTHTYRLTATSDGYPKSVDITVEVTPISLEGAEVTVKDLTYNGKMQLPTVTVTLDGKTLKNTDFDVNATMQTNAGSYTLTVNGNGNYSGKIENVEWKIKPMKIDSVMVSTDISKVYDGTATVTKTAEEWAKILTFKTLSAYPVVDVPSDAYTISDAYFVGKSGEETIHSPDAGEKYGITFKIALKSNNYVLQTYGEETPVMSKEITQSGGATFTIEQAGAPNMSAIRLEQYVFNGLSKTYEIDLKTLLPELTKPCEYGDITYGTPSVTLNDAYYDMETGAKIENGKLLLPIKATGTVKGEIGTVTVDVTTTNYKPFKLTLNTIAQDKIPLDKSGVTVSASEITYGQTLADSKLTVTGKMKCPRTGEEVKGTFAWTNPEAKPGAAGDSTASWTFTPAAGYEEYAPAIGTVTIKVNKATPTFTAPTAQENLTYTGQEQALITAGSVTNYGTMQYSLTENGTYSQDIPVGTDAGAYTVWYRVIGDANHNDTTPASVAVRIGQKPLTITGVTAASKPYDGTTNAGISSVTFDNVTLNRGTDYTVAASFDDAGVGSGKSVTATVSLMEKAAKNYALEQSSFPTTGSITKAAAPDFTKETALTIVNGHEKTYTVTLPALSTLETPKEYGALTYEIGEIKLNDGYYTSGAKVENGELTLPIQKNDVETTGSVGTVTVEIKSANYEDITLTVNVSAKNRITPTGTPTLSKNAIIYGDALNTIALSGKLHDNVNNKNVEGMFMWADGTVKPSAGSYEAAWKFTPTDGGTYAETTGTVTITVNKAKPTGAPIYTRITAAKKTLADANLKSNTSWPTGTIQWVDKDGKELPDTTEVKANTAYKWIFTPGAEFAANYTTATGELTLYSVSTGGGGGGGSSSGSTVKTDTVTNPDGSVTKTETKSDGTVVETTTGKDGIVSKTTTNPNGSSVTETKAADGSTGTVKTDKHGQTTAETTLSSKAIEDAKRNGEPVKAPVEVKASRNSNTAPTVKVELPKGTGETKVEIPVSNVKPGTVAVLVHPDGTEEIVKNSLPTEDGIQLTINGGATVKIVDNSKGFIDTQDHWAKDAIDFVSARGLVNGMSATIYAPDTSTTRAQLWTILARQNDSDLTGGSIWYEKAQNWAKEKGISDGTNPNSTINRAQMVTMLWRAAGSPAAQSGTVFQDVAVGSYYGDAVDWAVAHGITTGVGGGLFAPNSTCTRAQIATFLYRLYLSR